MLEDRRTDPILALRGRDIVCISSIDWDFLWQGHQEIMSRFAGAGNRVVFVENTGARGLRPRDLPRVLHRLRRSLRGADDERRLPHGVAVISPLLIPFPRSRVARALNEHVFVPMLARAVRQRFRGEPIIFSFLPTPIAVGLIRRLRTAGSTVVYYCIADFTELSDLGEALVRSERDLVRGADLVFVQAESFAQRFAALNARIHLFQFGVDVAAFAAADRTESAPELAGLRRPVIGYSGGLHRHVDFDLLRTVARSLDCSVVLVGPLQADIGPLGDEANVHVLGQRRFDTLPALLRGFDVAVVPYLINGYTRTVFPTKLFEYLAAGRPVVSTDLPEVRRLNLPDWAVRVCGTPNAFVDAVRTAVTDERPDHPTARRELARPRDWSAIVADMAHLIATAAER